MSQLLKEERHDFILNELKVRNRVLLTDLALKLNISQDTVRRDLKYLHDQGKVKKVHGGAVSTSFHLYTYKEQEIYAYESKSVIARKAHTLLKDGQVIIMSGGTTNLEFARLFPKNISATVFTPSLPIAMQLLDHENVQTIFVGGRLSHDAQIALGGETIQTLLEVRADLCFLGTGHLHPAHGLMEFDWEVVQLKKAMIQASAKIISLTISEKINSTHVYRVCDTSAINVLITEKSADDPILLPFKGLGIEIL